PMHRPGDGSGRPATLSDGADSAPDQAADHGPTRPGPDGRTVRNDGPSGGRPLFGHGPGLSDVASGGQPGSIGLETADLSVSDRVAAGRRPLYGNRRNPLLVAVGPST